MWNILEKLNMSGLYYDFMGSMEIRSGFIEVRDSDWNIVVRKIDISSARTLAGISRFMKDSKRPGTSGTYCR